MAIGVQSATGFSHGATAQHTFKVGFWVWRSILKVDFLFFYTSIV
jgi:hypothetical protein